MNLFILAQDTITPAGSGAPLRVFAAILLLVILCGLIWVLRHLGRGKGELRQDDAMRKARGARDNMILIICAVLFAAICLLLFVLVTA